MSKKIIYLLSLLMALSLVFASCKKNSGTDPNGGPANETTPEHNEEGVGGGGLYDDSTNIPADKAITKDPILKYSGDRGYRNPIGVVMGKSKNHVLVFTELRYAKTTADNDIGVDGATAADIYLTYSANSGTKDTFTEYGVIGTTSPQAPTTEADKSHAAPVVFKISDTEVIVVASGGVGISRVETPYNDRGIESKIDYCVVTLTEATGTAGASIKTTEWKELQVTYTDGGGTPKTIKEAIDHLCTSKGWKDAANQNYGQFGTHSARGFVTADNRMVLPVVVANQGTSSASTEYMGNLILVSTAGNADTPWTLASYTTFDKGSGNYTKQKESRVIANENGNYQYLVVPNGAADHNLTFGTAATSETPNAAPKDMSTFSAWDGSLGYLTLNWYGAGTYEPKTYDPSAGDQKSLLMHVKDHEKNPTIYLVDKGTINVVGKATGWTVVENDGPGKGSSIDVLGDGTIITVAEEYAPEGERKFEVVFSRYSQAYLASKIQ